MLSVVRSGAARLRRSSRLFCALPDPPRVQAKAAAVRAELAAREDTDRAGIALAFVLAHPSAPIAITGSQNPARIEAAAQALSVSLTRQDVYALIEASEGVPLP